VGRKTTTQSINESININQSVIIIIVVIIIIYYRMGSLKATLKHLLTYLFIYLYLLTSASSTVTWTWLDVQRREKKISGSTFHAEGTAYENARSPNFARIKTVASSNVVRFSKLFHLQTQQPLRAHHISRMSLHYLVK